MNAKYFAIACALVILVMIVELIRREKLDFKYSLAWFFAGIVVLFLAVYDKLLSQMAHLAGFTLLSNFIFFLTMLFVIFLSLRHSLYASQQNRRSEILAQNLAVLEYRLQQLEENRKRAP